MDLIGYFFEAVQTLELLHTESGCRFDFDRMELTSGLGEDINFVAFAVSDDMHPYKIDGVIQEFNSLF